MIIPFVFFYTVDPQVLTGRGSRSEAMGKMYGETFTAAEFFEQVTAYQLAAILFENRRVDVSTDDGLRQESAAVLTRMRLLREARAMKIDHVTDDELRERISTMRAFADNDGNFDRKAFDSFKNNQLPYIRNRRTGESLTAQGFDQIVREQIVLDRLRTRITAALTISEPEVQAAYVEQYATCTAHAASFSFYDYLPKVDVSEDDVSAFFEEKKATEYKIGPQTQIQVAQFRATDYKAESDVTDEEIVQYYNDNLEKEFKQKELHLRHIMVQIPPKADDGITAKALELTEKIAEGLTIDNFAEMAAEHSDDRATSDKAGDLGMREERRLLGAYGATFVKAVNELSPGTISGPIQSKQGYHLVQKLAERDQQPLEEVRGRIKISIERQRDEALARKQYDANEKYKAEQVNARHILIKTDGSDTPEQRAEKRARLNDLRDKALAVKALRDEARAIVVDTNESSEIQERKRAKIKELTAKASSMQDFAALAREFSEDEGSAPKGGSLGFFTRDRMVKPFADMAFSIADGEISEIVESQFGFHIIERVMGRSETPFSEAKYELIRKIQSERDAVADRKAQQDAVNFSVAAYQELLTDSSTPPPAADFAAFARDFKTKHSSPMMIIESGFFTANGSVPNVGGSTHTLALAASKLTPASPLSDVIDGNQVYYVAYWQAGREPSVPAFKEANGKGDEVLTAQALRAKSDLKRDKAIEMARDAATELHATIQTQLAEGKSFREAIGDHGFDQFSFPLLIGPMDDQRPVRNSTAIKEVAEKTPAKTLAPVKNVDDGAVIVYITEHRLPTPDNFDDLRTAFNLSQWMGDGVTYRQFRDVFLEGYRAQQEQSALEGYYKLLEEQSKTAYFDDWRFVFDARPETAQQGDDHAHVAGS